jgi:hypothetical protein
MFDIPLAVGLAENGKDGTRRSIARFAWHCAKDYHRLRDLSRIEFDRRECQAQLTGFPARGIYSAATLAKPIAAE